MPRKAPKQTFAVLDGRCSCLKIAGPSGTAYEFRDDSAVVLHPDDVEWLDEIVSASVHFALSGDDPFAVPEPEPEPETPKEDSHEPVEENHPEDDRGGANTPVEENKE